MIPPGQKNPLIVRFCDLTLGNRFLAYGILWAVVEVGRSGGTARKISTNYRDAICSFDFDEQVEFVPPFTGK